VPRSEWHTNQSRLDPRVLATGTLVVSKAYTRARYYHISLSYPLQCDVVVVMPRDTTTLDVVAWVVTSDVRYI
jgi:hypothetical protein